MQRTVYSQRYSALADALILLLVAATIYGVISMGAAWRSDFQPVTKIDLSAWALPRYTLLSAMRGTVAYFISLGFTLVVGYMAAKNRAAERILIPLVDVLQSIPVLGFLPGLVLGLIAIFPRTNTGLELAAIIMIFTGQAWNMTLSFYSSLKSLPKDFEEASTVIGFSAMQKLIRVELPFSAVNLAWNSLLSMAGGWFFLSVCEAFTLGTQEYRLPGLGSYVAVAVSEGNRQAMIFGVFAMVLLIVSMDFFIWRPILAWVQRFRLEDVPGAAPPEPLMRLVIRESRLIRGLRLFFRRSWRHHHHHPHDGHPHARGEGELLLAGASTRSMAEALARFAEKQSQSKLARSTRAWLSSRQGNRVLEWAVFALFILSIAWAAWRLLQTLLTVEPHLWFTIIRNTFWTFLRVVLTIAISTLWAVPAGIWIGTSSRRIRVAQPIIQILASFPAPMLYPIMVAGLFAIGVGFDWASMILMLVGVQWYVLFNVLAGALRIPRELGDALSLMEASRIERWRTLYLPSVFPALVTGWITAAGGAWNASIVAEAGRYFGQDYETGGLGAMIAQSTAAQDFRLLAACLFIMVVVVIGLNRLVWAPIYRLAQTRYRLDL